MTVTSLKLKVTPRLIKVGLLPKYPASISGGNGIDVTNTNGAIAVALDLLRFQQITNFDPSKEFALVTDALGNCNLVSLTSILTGGTAVQIITAAGDVVVSNTTQLLVMNRTVDQNPSNIILPLAVNKAGPLKIVDFKGNAGAFPHTIKTTAPDTFQGAATQWSLDGNGASVALDPIPNVGYAV